MRIAVLGLGYVGCVSAACLARLGHLVTGVDRDQHKVDSVLAARAPFHEPGLESLIQAGVGAGLLTATTDMAVAVQSADVVFICVGTPSEVNGNLGLDQLTRICAEIRPLLAERTESLVIAVRSTVFPGTAEEVVIPTLGGPHSMVKVVSNPEFLREGTAVKDFMEPSLVVVGGEDRLAVETVASLYDPLGFPACLVSLRTAEMIKYACNAFHAVKIVFANEIGSLAMRLGVDSREVMTTLCRDEKLNVSAAYLMPGFAFGGSCLPKDLRALAYRASRLDVEVPMLSAVLPSNTAHLNRAIRHVLAQPSERLGVIGLAFKEDTDDVRESPVVSMLEYLIGKGRNVRVFDPHIRMDAIYGSNRHFILASIPHISKLMDESLERMLEWADHLVLAQKQSPAVMERIRASGLPVIDLVNKITG
jgi:GDP-mannose 6-dehydrogenase